MSCGNSSDVDNTSEGALASASASASDSSAPSPSATRTLRDLQFPDDFVKQMAHENLVLEPPGDAKPVVSSDVAIDRAIAMYALFSRADPVVAGFYRVTMPLQGPLSDPDDPGSPVIPTYKDDPMWVIYARADMVKDETRPELGLVKGTVIVVVTSRGEPIRAMTF